MNQFEMKQRAYQSNLKNRALQVLLYLIDRANKEQTCFPAVPTIGRELHISISTVKRAMRELVEAGYVKKESRFREGNRGQTSNLYILLFTKSKKESQNENIEIYQEDEDNQVNEKQNEKIKMELPEVETTQCITECNEANYYIENGIDFSEDIKAKGTINDKCELGEVPVYRHSTVNLIRRHHGGKMRHVDGGGGQNDTTLKGQFNIKNKKRERK